MKPVDLRAKRAYLALQGLSVWGWWVVLAVAPALREHFAPITAATPFLYAFLPGDLALVGGGSLAAAFGWRSGRPPPTAWIAAGALWLTTTYVAGLWYAGELLATGPTLMALASAGTAWAVLPSHRDRS